MNTKGTTILEFLIAITIVAVVAWGSTLTTKFLLRVSQQTNKQFKQLETFSSVKNLLQGTLPAFCNTPTANLNFKVAEENINTLCKKSSQRIFHCKIEKQEKYQPIRILVDCL